MKHKSKCRRTAIVRDTWNQTIHEAKGHGVGNQEKDECRVKRKLYLQASRQGHLLRMWVIFYEDNSVFTHIDKNIFGLVEDKDILEFQKSLADSTGEMSHELTIECFYLQNFVGNRYFARRYVPKTLCTDTNVRQGPQALEIPKASLFRDVELPSPCSNGQ
jgi:hypothetical protein